ncbi:MAG: von Willebrand factor type A domain-containing protein, partial [Planctomycetota bacterium]|nr:von Willebrand factor type A domain-containing protein [Planctomycetota bacterium]
AIGVGGGAAGSYGSRFGKGRRASTGKKQEAKEGSAAQAAAEPKKPGKVASAGRKKSPPNKDGESSKNRGERVPPSPVEEEAEAGGAGDLPRDQALQLKELQELPQQDQRARSLVKRKVALGRSRLDLETNTATKLRQELSKVAPLELQKKQEQEQEETEGGELFAGEASFADAKAERPLLGQLSQSLQKAARDGQLDYRRNDWAYNLNIAKTQDGYSPAGKGALPREQGRLNQQRQAAGDGPVEINEKALNSYAWYQRLDPNLSYEQFNSRALTIPAPALGDEGLGEKGFREKYGVNPFVATNRDHLSTFGMDVDNASWGRTLETIRERRLPPPETVRVEEFINNFPDPRPGNPGKVFTVYTEGGPSPFGDHDLELVQVTIKSRKLRQGERRDAILTFAIDTSGSMADTGKLRLLKDSIRTLVSNLSINDRVAIVAFSTNAYVVLPHTSVRQKTEIDAAIDSLQANGGTNIEAGIDLAYRLAAESGNRRAANRVILCSDGVANLGARGPEVVLKRIRRYARDNLVSLFTYAFGTGGRQAVRGDRMLQRLADEGDGRYQYVDSASTSRDIFSLPDQLQILASDAKIQVDFNPDVVSHYRLLGYEKRDIADKDFRNDKVDAGEVGPGATVTALYEIKRSRPVGSLGRIRLRYLDTLSGRVEETDFDLPPGVLAEKLTSTTERFRLIASVAEFAELLRGSYYARNGSYGAILELMSTFSTAARNRLDFAEIYQVIGKAQGLCAVRTLQDIKE